MQEQLILELVSSGNRDLSWLKRALQAAIQVEFFTIPPYLTAFWSVKDQRDPVAIAIREVLVEEMLHMSLACNMLAAIGGTPRICSASVVPRYPDSLPGGVKPKLRVGLQGLSKHSLNTFMQIEEPEQDISFLEAAGDTQETFPRIGAFYDAVERAFESLEPAMNRDRQIAGYFGESQHPDGSSVPKTIGTLEDVSAAIKLIKDQGEGTRELVSDPDTGELAHYYRFKEIAVGRKLIRARDGRWVHQGEKVDLPECWPVAEVPDGGYDQQDVPGDVWDKMYRFDVEYTKVLQQIENAWSEANQASLHQAIETMMSSLPILARQIMEVPLDRQPYNYGPCFRLVEGTL